MHIGLHAIYWVLLAIGAGMYSIQSAHLYHVESKFSEIDARQTLIEKQYRPMAHTLDRIRMEKNEVEGKLRRAQGMSRASLSSKFISKFMAKRMTHYGN